MDLGTLSLRAVATAENTAPQIFTSIKPPPQTSEVRTASGPSLHRRNFLQLTSNETGHKYFCLGCLCYGFPRSHRSLVSKTFLKRDQTVNILGILGYKICYRFLILHRCVKIIIEHAKIKVWLYPKRPDGRN